MLKKSFSSIEGEKGMAVVELIPTLIVFMLLINFSLGLFGAIHSGILNSIAARNYFFETLRHRSNVGYHRDHDSPNTSFHTKGYRFGGIVQENPPNDNGWFATARPIAFTSGFGGQNSRSGVDLSERRPSREPDAVNRHNQQVPQLNEAIRNDEGQNGGAVEVTQIWLKQIYGICLNARCGD